MKPAVCNLMVGSEAIMEGVTKRRDSSIVNIQIRHLASGDKLEALEHFRVAGSARADVRLRPPSGP